MVAPLVPGVTQVYRKKLSSDIMVARLEAKKFILSLKIKKY